MRIPILVLAALLGLAACGPGGAKVRRERALTDIRGALGRGDAAAAVQRYSRWRARQRGADDPQALRMIAVAALERSLREDSPGLTARAIRAVERHQIEELEGQLARLVTAGEPVVAATAAIARYRTHPLAPAVAANLLHSPDPDARAIAVAGIAREVGRPSRRELLELRDDPSPAVRQAVAAALAAFGSRRDRDRLLDLARDDPEPAVRARALRAFIRRAREVPLDVVRDALADPHLGVRHAALELLGARGDAAAESMLLQAAVGEDLSVAFRALVALRRAGLEVPVATLERGLESGRWTERVAALGALIESAPRPEALRLAEAAARDPRVEVRLAAARVLQRLGQGARARRELGAILEQSRGMPRLGAAVALARHGDPRGVATIERLARRGGRPVRAGALRAHRILGRTTPALVDALADPVPAVRLLATEVVLHLLGSKKD